MTITSPTPAQHTILAKAISASSDKIDWFPDNIKGGARKKALDGMFNCILVTNDGTNWFVTAGDYDILGIKCSNVTPSIPEVDVELEHAVVTTEATWTPVLTQAKPRTRDNSKQAEVIWVLQRPEGTTIGRICIATG